MCTDKKINPGIHRISLLEVMSISALDVNAREHLINGHITEFDAGFFFRVQLGKAFKIENYIAE